MKTKNKRKNYYLDEGKKSKIETLDKALEMIMFRTELLESLKKVSGKGGLKGMTK